MRFSIDIVNYHEVTYSYLSDSTNLTNIDKYIRQNKDILLHIMGKNDILTITIIYLDGEEESKKYDKCEFDQQFSD
jgi:hypothetical protein